MNIDREQLPETVNPGDVIENVQLTPFGDWPNGGVVQHVTREACDAMVADWIANGSKEVLLDFEHKSAEGGTSDTSAAAWISNIRVDPERGLVGDFRFTDVGADAIANRRLRFLSPVWRYRVDAERVVKNKKVPAEVTPVQLLSCGLTNKPAIPVDPILNKEPPAGNETVEDNKENPNMDKIKEALGLAPEATEEDVLNAIAAMVKTNKEAEEARKAAEQQALEDEAERFSEENKTKCNKEVLKAQYLANKEVAKALVAGIPEQKEEPQTLLNKGKTPEKSDVLVMLNKCKGSAERIAFAKAHAQELLDAAK